MDIVRAGDAFGKIRRVGGIVEWHPLVAHLIDVASCFECICRCHSIRRAMDMAAKRPLTNVDLQRLCVLVFLHDLGKANSGFQSKRWANESERPSAWPMPAGHGLEAIKLFTDESLQPIFELLPIAHLTEWGGACFSLICASISHHGRPIVEGVVDWNRSVWRPVITPEGNYYPEKTVSTIVQQVQKLYPQAFVSDGNALPDAPEFGHLFAGLVQLADWLGSDTRFFNYLQPNEDRAAKASEWAQRAVVAIGLDVSSWRDALNSSSPGFTATFGIQEPRPMQSAMSDSKLGPLIILESETGSGKTEAALWRFVHLFRAGLVDSLFFALPTRAAATQLCARIEVVVKRLWPNNTPLTVRALPGYVGADGAGAIFLPEFNVLWSDSPDDQVAHQRWAAENAKRFLAAPIAVGTIDQVLMSVLPVRHAHLRHALLARSFLVIDEVHASDEYMTILLERLLFAHLKHGGHALLLSATLGSIARSRYLGLGGASICTPDFDAACRMPYPAIADSQTHRPVVANGQQKVVHWTTHGIIDSPAQIAEMAIEAASQSAKVLIIRNTVPDAVATLQALEIAVPDRDWLFAVGNVVALHHSRFSRKDRPLLDTAVEQCLGKTRPPGPRIVIGTQTLEQSLDIDADLLICDVCPIDVLLQRIGRLHRFLSLMTRPATFQTAHVRVLTPRHGDLAILLKRPRHGLGQFPDGGGVYVDLRIIAGTLTLIQQRPIVQIPRDNRLLVESATHPDRLHEIESELGNEWARAGQRAEGSSAAKRSLAYQQMLDFDTEFGKEEFREDLRIATRLGAQDRVVEFPIPLVGPFGQPLDALPIRFHLLPAGLSSDAVPTDINQSQGVIEFSLGDARYRYSRFGLARVLR